MKVATDSEATTYICPVLLLSLAHSQTVQIFIKINFSKILKSQVTLHFD